MKSFLASLVLALYLGLALADPIDPSRSAILQKEKQAFEECNSTHPVQRDPRVAMGVSIITGEKMNLTQEEKCFLFCFLQKVNFVNEKAEIKNGAGLVNITVHVLPQMGNYVHTLISHLYITSKWTKTIEDKCKKAFTTYLQYNNFIYTVSLGDIINRETKVKDKAVNAIQTGQPFDNQEVSEGIKKFLEDFEKLIPLIAKS